MMTYKELQQKKANIRQAIEHSNNKAEIELLENEYAYFDDIERDKLMEHLENVEEGR